MQKIKFLAIVILASLVTVLVGCGSEEIFMPEIVGSVKSPVYKSSMPPRKVILGLKSLEQVLQGRLIVIDAGHGGYDPGCGEVGYSRLPEKALVLVIAKDIETQLKACGARVIMTRTGDCFVPLDERAAIADRHETDLLLSIHTDSCSEGYVSGPTVYVANKAGNQSRRVANSILLSFVTTGISSNGMRHADFRVLAKHSRPAVLVECGYLTNSNDAQKLNDRRYQKHIAKLISNGIILAFEEVK